MIKRKHVLILMHNYDTQFIDIANQYVTLFDKNKYKVTVAYLSGKADDAVKNKTISEEIVFLNCSKKNIRGLKIAAIQKLILLCRKESFTIAISHRYKPIYIMLCVSAFCRIAQNVFVMHAMKTVKNPIRRVLIAALAQKNSYFAGVSNAVRDDLRHHIWRVPKERIITLYNCIDMKTAENKLFSKKEARHQLNIPENTLLIGTVGRLAPEKDQKTLIYAFLNAKPFLPDAKLLLIGDGPLEQDLKQLVKQLQLQDDVIFSGFVPDAQRYLKAFDIFMLTSTREAFGRVLIEAMIAKVPVIGTRTNGIPEVIGDAGILVEAGHAPLLSSAIQEIAMLPPAEKALWGDKGYDRVKTHFSTDQFRKDFWQFAVDA